MCENTDLLQEILAGDEFQSEEEILGNSTKSQL